MKVLELKNKRTFWMIVGLEGILLLSIMFLIAYNGYSNRVEMVMGGRFYNQVTESEEHKTDMGDISEEKYFRPSKLPILNNKNFNYLINESYNKKSKEITVPKNLLNAPEDTIVNYFSVLREAANYEEGKGAGCGTLGQSLTPYPVAYNFLTETYKNKLRYEDYLKSFKNILHINLIKSREIPTDENHPNSKKYFVEIETIEGSDRGAGQFAYYYGYVYLNKEGDQYKISDLDFYGENYLCAPYHGWSYIAEYVVDIKYGNWCNLVKERYPTEQDGYVKKIYFKGTDGNDYLIEFLVLTNDNDVEIAQYKKSTEGKWELIKIDPEKCLESNTY